MKKTAIYILSLMAVFTIIAAAPKAQAETKGGDDGYAIDAVKGGDDGYTSDSAKGGDDGYAIDAVKGGDDGYKPPR